MSQEGQSLGPRNVTPYGAVRKGMALILECIQ